MIAGISILVCIFPHIEVKPILGMFIGGFGNAYYPVIPYYLYFVIGVYFVRKEIKFNWYVLGGAVVGTAYMIYDFIIVSKGWPSRFPLSLAWLVGAMLFLYGYYLLSGLFGKKKYFLWLCEIGKNSISYLLLSNILIFALKQSRFFKMSSTYSLGLFAIIMCVIWYMISLIKGKVQKVMK
jgi:hypothetical protein